MCENWECSYAKYDESNSIEHKTKYFKYMKIPKTIKIGGYTWDIKPSKDYGASFSFTTRVIKLPFKYDNWKECLLHEILEIIMVDNNARYNANEAGMEFLFSFQHDKLCSVAKDLYQVLKDNGLLK